MRVFPPITALADGARFSDRLVALGYAGDATTAFEVATSEPILSDTPYVAFREGDRAANDRHYYACQRRNRPMVTVKLGKKKAELEWDCITINPDLETYLYGTDEGHGFTQAMIMRFRVRVRDEAGDPEYVGGAFTGRVTGLSPDIARLLAEDYYRMLSLTLRQGTKVEERAG